MLTPDWITAIVATVIPMGGLVVWLLRFEGIVKYSRRDIDRLEKEVDKLNEKHSDLESKIIEKLSVIEKNLSKIQGMIEREQHENQ